ncbi:MAG: hypothetical protein Q8Q09_09515 [Deltaproteobacteria bacterium]|nr:hypothetical protein [Deltaproteobacteria bacterium]
MIELRYGDEILLRDRVIVALAVMVVGATGAAIAPPTGEPAQGLRVEQLAPTGEGRPVLLRVTLEDGALRRWRAPRGLRVRERAGPSVRLTQHPRSPWLLLTLSDLDSARPLVLEAEGLSASVPLARGADAHWDHRVRGGAPGPLDVRVEGGVLTPEIGGSAVIHAGSEHAGERIVFHSDDPTLAVSPERATLDACGLAALYLRPAGLAAPLLVQVNEGREHRLRLPLHPGAITAHFDDDRHLQIAHALGDIPAFVVHGDARGPLAWELVALAASDQSAVTRSLTPPRGAQWSIVSSSSDFDRFAGGWSTLPQAPSGCTESPLAARFARMGESLWTIPPALLRYDGAQAALTLRTQRVGRIRRVASWVGAAALMALALLLLSATRSREQSLDEQGLTRGSPTQRIVAIGLFVLAILAVLLAMFVQLKTAT